MIKCKDNGIYTCISKTGNPKSRWKTDKEVIDSAKYLNTKYPSTDTKLVGYKCSHCNFYHLTTVKIKKK
jgi:hypothetical protein